MIQLQDELNTLLHTPRTSTTAWLLQPLREREGLRELRLEAGEYVLGSAEDCHLVLPGAGIAPHHCRLRCEGNRLLVIAEDPRTWVNDGPVQKGHLKSGDRLTLGPVTWRLATIPGRASAVGGAVLTEADLSLLNHPLAGFLQRAARQARIDPGSHPLASEWPSTDQALDEVQNSIRTTQQQLWTQQQILNTLSPPQQGKQAEQQQAIWNAPLPPVAAVDLEEPVTDVVATEPQPTEQTSSDSEANRQTLQKQLQRLLRLKEKLRGSHTRREAELQEARQHLKKLQQEAQQQQASYRDRLREIEQAETVRVQQEQNWLQQIQKLSSETALLQQLVAEADAEKQTLTTLMTSLETELSAATSQLQQHSEFEEQLHEISAHAQGLEQQAQAYRLQMEQLQIGLQTCQQQLTEQSTQFAEQQKRREQQTADLQSQIEASRQREASLQTELERCEQERSATAAELLTLQQQLVSLQTEKESLTASVQELQATMEQLQSAPEESLLDTASFDEEWERISDERDRILQVRLELEEQRDAFTQAQQDLREVREEAEQEQRALQEQAEELTAESLRLSLLKESLEEQQRLLNSQLSSSETTASSPSAVEQSLFTELTEPVSADEVQTLSVHDLTDGAEATTKSGLIADSQELVSSESSETSPSDLGPPLEALQALFGELEHESHEAAEVDLPVEWPTDELSETAMPLESFPVSFAEEDVPEENAEEQGILKETVQTVKPANKDAELDKLREELAHMFGFSSADKSSPTTASKRTLSGEADLESDDETDESEPAGFSGEEHGGENLEQRLLSENDDDLAATLQSALFRPEQIDDEDPLTAEQEEAEEEFVEEEEETSAHATPASALSSAATDEEIVVEDIEDADSVAAYMERLFARTNGRQNYSEPSSYQTTQNNPAPVRPAAKKASASSPASLPQTTTPQSASAQTLPVPVERIRPIAQLDREMMKREIESLRDVANQTARNALATHAWKQVRTKMLASGILTLVSGISAAVLITSPYWSPVSYQNYGWLTLLLTLVSATELFRSRLVLMRLKQAKKQQKLTEVVLEQTEATEPTEQTESTPLSV